MTRDAGDSIATWRDLLDPEYAPLLAEAGEMGEPSLTNIARLRRRWTPEQVDAAIELARARKKAARKFPDPDRLMADVEGVEQATSLDVAIHKTLRFAALPPGLGAVHDLCCGIGGDAMALARRGEVLAVDRSPLAWMTEHNAGCVTRVADVESLPLDGFVFHLDPSRRVEGGGRQRRHDYADYEPGPAFVERLLAACPDGAIKLGPGVNIDELPLDGERELEFVNEAGTLVQAVLWCGRLAHHPGQRTASRIPDGLSFTARPIDAWYDAPYDAKDGILGSLFVADPAIERAGLLGPLCDTLPVRPIHPGLGLLTSDEPIASPWLTAYEVIATLPWRPRKIRAWLRAHDAGIVTVKTRGGAVDADRAQRDFRGDGEQPFTVFGLRLGKKILAVITRPDASPSIERQA